MSTYTKRISYREKTLGGSLLELDIELTERCNNNCVHCFINLPKNDRNAKKEEMSLAEIKEILRQAADLGCLNVRFTGGEPLLNPEFEAIYLFTRRLGMRVQLFTNACLMTTHLARLFSTYPPLEMIEVTVYGMSKESYETNTQQPGSFKTFKRGVQLLLDYNIPFVVKSVLLPGNKNEMAEFKSWSKTGPWMDKQPGITVFLDLRSRHDDPKKNETIKYLRPSPEEAVKFIQNYNEENDPNPSYENQILTNAPGDQLFGCGAGDKRLAIDSYGRIQACTGLRSPDLVLPRGTSLIEGLTFYKSLIEIRAVNPKYLEQCANFFLRNLCEQCPARSWSENGTLDRPIDYFCEVTHELARQLGWLQVGKKAWEVNYWKDKSKP